MSEMTTSSMRPVRTLAVASGKGGVGKTNLSVNLAVSLAEFGQQVLLLDADLGLGNVDVLLGLKPEKNLSHVLSGECGLDDIVVTGPKGIRVVPASSGTQHLSQLSSAELASIVNAFGAINDPIDTLIVDTSAGVADNVLSFCRAVHDVVVVACDEPTSLADSYALVKILVNECDVDRIHTVASMVSGEGQGAQTFRTLDSVARQFLGVGLKFLGEVPDDRYLRKAVRARRAVVDAYPLSRAALAYRQLAGAISRWPADDELSGQVQFFFERLVSVSSDSQRVPH